MEGAARWDVRVDKVAVFETTSERLESLWLRERRYQCGERSAHSNANVVEIKFSMPEEAWQSSSHAYA